jgi:hypothetical protein
VSIQRFGRFEDIVRIVDEWEASQKEGMQDA